MQQEEAMSLLVALHPHCLVWYPAQAGVLSFSCD